MRTHGKHNESSEFQAGQRESVFHRSAHDRVYYRAPVVLLGILGFSVSERSWYKSYRSNEAFDLIRASHPAFILVHVIASRARYSDGYNRFQCKLGEAAISDYQSYSLSKQQYRTAKRYLESNGLATFRTTPKGTLAKLVDSTICESFGSPVNTQPNIEPTPSQHPPNTQPTPNVEGNRRIEGIENIGEKPQERKCFIAPSIEEVKLSFEKSGGPPAEAEAFFNFYSSKGWMVGKNRMQSVPHSVAGWIARWRQKTHEQRNGSNPNKGKELTSEQILAISRGDIPDPRYER